MRPQRQTSSPSPTTNRCALTARLRYRAQVAEADAKAAREEADVAMAAAREEVDAAWNRVSVLRERMEADRAALTRHVESPEWERDLLIMARDRVRAELIRLSQTHHTCQHCGSFGREFQKRFLQKAIDTITAEHGLPPAPPLPEPEWAVPQGYRIRKGRPLDTSWHREADRPRATRTAIW